MPRTLSASTVSQVARTPKLWNAKKKIDTSKGLPAPEIQRLKKEPYSLRWRSFVSPDVVAFVDKIEGRDSTGQPVNVMHPDDKLKLLSNPARYFSRPHNVPENLREQALFPTATVSLMRTPHLGPYFAQFMVPLSFGKLNLKSYLKNVYNVDVSHIRSFVVYQKKDRKRASSRYTKGKLFQNAFKKKMTVQLVDPFEWPAEPKKEELNGSIYEKQRYWDSRIKHIRQTQRDSEPITTKANDKHRISIAAQAQALLSGRSKWQPTWKQITSDARAMEGRHYRGLPSPTGADAASNSSSSLQR